MSNKTTFRLLAAGALVALAMPTVAAAQATDTLTARATIQSAFTVECTGDLDFGTLLIAPSNSSRSVTVAASDSATPTSNGPDVTVQEGTGGPVACAVTNPEGASGSVTLDGASGNFSGSELSDIVLSFESNTLTGSAEVSKNSSVGTETIFVGGSLTIPSNHTAFGTYQSDAITITITN
jgi:hypothetical protein